MSILNKPSTFSSNTAIESSEVNANFDTIYNDYNGGIAAANLATGAVTTAKIADSNVTTAKIADSNVTTAKINDDAVTPAKWTNPYCFRAYASGGITLADGVAQKVTFGTEDYDYANNFATSTYTVPVAGVYHFDAGFTFSSGVGTQTLARAMVYKNGSLALPGYTFSNPISADAALTVFGDLLLAVNDTIEIWGIYTGGGGTEATSTGTTKTWFNGHLVSPQ